MMGNTVQKGLWLDPRAKLFLILMCVLCSMFAPSLSYQFALVLLIAVLGVLCGKWKYSIKGVCFYAVVCSTRSSSSFTGLASFSIPNAISLSVSTLKNCVRGF